MKPFRSIQHRLKNDCIRENPKKAFPDISVLEEFPRATRKPMFNLKKSVVTVPNLERCPHKKVWLYFCSFFSQNLSFLPTRHALFLSSENIRRCYGLHLRSKFMRKLINNHQAISSSRSVHSFLFNIRCCSNFYLFSIAFCIYVHIVYHVSYKLLSYYVI